MRVPPHIHDGRQRAAWHVHIWPQRSSNEVHGWLQAHESILWTWVQIRHDPPCRQISLAIIVRARGSVEHCDSAHARHAHYTVSIGVTVYSIQHTAYCVALRHSVGVRNKACRFWRKMVKVHRIQNLCKMVKVQCAAGAKILTLYTVFGLY